MSSRETDARKAGALAPLPADFAFVVQFGRESDPVSGKFVGQVEHLASARQRRFSNQEDMLAFLEQMLAQYKAQLS